MRIFYRYVVLGAGVLMGTCASTVVPIGAGNIAFAETHPQSSILGHTDGSTPSIRYYIGDRLKLLIYERLDVPGQAQHAPDARPRLVERAEFTGTYTVQENGAIALPMLGNIDVDGLAPEEIAKKLEAEFYKVYGRPSQVSVLLDEREPVYVVGPSVTNGTLKYTPGMTVLHAVANAGLTDTVKGDAYVRMELLREREREQKARAKLRSLLARHAVLSAELAGESEPKPDDRLTVLSGAPDAQAAVDAEARRRQVLLESRKPVLDSYAAEVAIANQRKAILMSKLQIADESVKNHEVRDGALENLKTRGDANGFFSAQVKGDLADVKLRRTEILGDISTMELELARAEKERARATADAKTALNQELTTIEDEILDTEASLSGAQHVLEDLDSERFKISVGSNVPVFELVRRTKQGPLRIKADEMTELHPGDLLEIMRPSEPPRYSSTQP